MPLQDLLVTLIGTLIGVLAAFRLDRAWEHRQSKQRYGQYLDACRYDLANLHGICMAIKQQVSTSSTIMLKIQAPVVDALLRDPILHEYGSHAFVVALRSTSGFIATTKNIMNHYRLTAAAGRSLTPTGVADTQGRMGQLVRVIEYVQGLVDTELKALKLGVVTTKEDEEILVKLRKILRDEK
jgi:hypothetical protein